MPKISETPYDLSRKKFDYQGKADLAETKNDKKSYIDYRSKAIYYSTRSNVVHGYSSALPSNVKTKQDAFKLAREMAIRETQYPSFGKKPEQESNKPKQTTPRYAVLSMKNPAVKSKGKPVIEVPYWIEFGPSIRKSKKKASKPNAAPKRIAQTPEKKVTKK